MSYLPSGCEVCYRFSGIVSCHLSHNRLLWCCCPFVIYVSFYKQPQLKSFICKVGILWYQYFRIWWAPCWWWINVSVVSLTLLPAHGILFLLLCWLFLASTGCWWSYYIFFCLLLLSSFGAVLFFWRDTERECMLKRPEGIGSDSEGGERWGGWEECM